MEICKICGFRHSDTYDKDAQTLVDSLLKAKYSVKFKLEGGGVNNLGTKILLKHALHFLEESK